MIDVSYTQLQAAIRERVKNISDFKKATSIALGVAVSKLVPIPTGTVDEADYYWKSNSGFEADRYLSNFNENIVVDIDLARDTARGFWLLRCAAAFPLKEAVGIPRGNADFIAKLYGSDMYLNPETLKFLNENSEVMVAITNRIQLQLVAKEERK